MLQKVRRGEVVSAKFAKYFVVGILAFIVDAGSFYVIRNAFSTTILVANACAVTAGASVSFVLNHIWVFKHKVSARASTLRLVIFFGNAILGFAFSTLVVHTASAISRHSRFASHVALVELFAKVGAIGVIVLWNYFVYRTVIFRPSHDTE